MNIALRCLLGILVIGAFQVLRAWLLKRQMQHLRLSIIPQWEVFPAIDDGELYGYKVRWSVPDDKGRYLWVRHYHTDHQPNDPSLAWCLNAAERDAERLNKQGRTPEYYE